VSKDHELRNKYIADGEKVIKERYNKIAIYSCSSEKGDVFRKISQRFINAFSVLKKKR